MATPKSKTAGPADRALRVTAKVDGFRRAGREWRGTTVVPMSELVDEQVQALLAEPMLLVDEIDTPKG